MDPQAVAANFWNKASLKKAHPRSRWWLHPTVIRHINKVVCGEPIDGVHAGFHRLLKSALSGRRADKAISVACGSGHKEISLVRDGIVGEFHLYEISSVRIEAGRKAAKQSGLQDRVFFHDEDAFETCTESDFDMVYWNNALHHMMDAKDAVRWSYDRMRPGALFAMDDFVGPSRFQWSDKTIEYGTMVRSWLAEEYFAHPTDPTKRLAKVVGRPTIEGMIAADPSEAADSSNIIPAIRARFSDPFIKATGGALYHTGLNDILANLDEERDAAYLFSVLAIDQALAEIGETQYAIAFANK